MPQQPSILDVLDNIQRPASPQDPDATRRDYYRGLVLTGDDVAAMARDLGADYGSVRQGVIDKGGRVDDGARLLDTLSEVQQKSPSAPGDSRSLFARTYDALFTPPEMVTRAAQRGGDVVEGVARGAQQGGILDALGAIPDVARNLLREPVATIRGGAAGAIEGLGSILTPGDVALTALGLPGVARGVRAARGGQALASALPRLQQIANVATAGRGLERVVDAESGADVAAGLAQAAIGGAGMASSRLPVRQAAPRREPLALPAGARFVAGPDGVTVPVGVDVAVSARPEPVSGGRGIPAAAIDFDASGRPIFSSDPSAVSRARPVRGQLGPGARFAASAGGQIAATSDEAAMTVLAALNDVQGVTPAEAGVRSVRAAVSGFNAAGRPIYSSDPSAVGVSRPVRGLLGPGPDYVAGPSGDVASTMNEEALSRLRAQHAPQAPGDAVSEVRSVPAAVLAREIDPTVRGREAVRVTQYTGDPEAVSVPLLSDVERSALVRARDELQTLTPQRGRLVRPDPRFPTDEIYSYGGPGASFANDVRVISAQHVSNADVAAAVDDLLAGKPITNKLQAAAVDAARGRLEGRPGYSRAQLPPADDFEDFAAIFDDVAPDPRGEPGEAGFVAAPLVSHLAGGAAGAAYGAASGEDPEDRLRRGILFGTAGAVAPAFLRSGAPGARVGRSIASAPTSPSATTAARRAEPLTVKGRDGKPLFNPQAGFEPFLQKFTNPVAREGIRQLLVDNAGYADQRRGRISAEALGKFAEEVRVNATKSLPKGTALNAEWIAAHARALSRTVQKVDDLAKVVNSGKGTDADLVALQAAQSEAQAIGKTLVGARAEAGRALAAFRLYSGILETGDVNIIRDALKAPGMREEAEQLAKGLAQQPNDPLERYRYLQRQAQPSLMDKARSVFYANILSGLKTHERNIIGNIANLTTNLLTQPFSVAADIARSGLTGAPRTLSLSELPTQAVALVSGMEQGFRDALFAMRHGVSPDALNKSLAAGELGKLDVPRVEFRGGAANPFNWPGRALDSADAFFRTAARETELSGLAHAQATREGLRGRAFDDRVATLRAGTTAEGQQLRAQAADVARRAVFQEPLGKVAGRFQALVRDVPGLSFVIPFIKTPANIMRQGAEFSPAGALMTAARQEGRAGAQAQGRAVAGSLAAGSLAYLAATGRLSGDGPRDAKARDALYESGWRPNSVRIGDQWVNYNLFQPLSVQAAVIANAYEAWQEQGGKSGDVVDVLAKTLARSANSFLDQSFLSGMYDFLEAVKDPERSASRFAGRLASSAVPFSAAVRTAQQATDPVVRQPRTIAETVKAGIPGLSEQVPARLTRFGEPTTREGGPVRRALDPFGISSRKDDPVVMELARLGVDIPALSDRMALPDGRTFTREESQAVKQRMGRAMRMLLQAEMLRPGYAAWSQVRQAEAVERAMSRARERVRRDVLDQIRRGQAVR